MSWLDTLLRGPAPRAPATRPYKRCFEPAASWREALRATVGEDALQLSGRCPRCGDDMDDFVSCSPEWLADLRGGSGRATVETVTACNCDSDHAGRPAGEEGCGAIAVLTVELTGTGDGLDASIAAARPATARDRSWDEEATRWDTAMNDRVAAVADRWGATVAALFGLVGFSLVLSGDQVTTAVASTASWPWWVLGGVLAAIAAACFYGWVKRAEDEPADGLLLAAWIVALLAAAGVLGYAAWRGVPVDAGPTFGILAGIAVLFGLSATGFAGLAAQGSPKWVSYLTGNRMRTLRMESADRSARNLRRARIATVVAVGALVTALAVMWYAPAARPGVQQVVVRTSDGRQVCGALLPYSGAGVALDPQGDEPRLVISRALVIGLTAVDACPSG